MDINKQVNTAGAFILFNDLFVFMVGPNQENDLYVVRLGGHKENNETAVECLKREINEEASISVIPVNSPITYYVESWNEEPCLLSKSLKGDLCPIIIKGKENGSLSLLYFAYSDEEPKPDSETHGILFLTLKDIDSISNEMITIEDFLKSGGKALFRKELRKDVTLKPGAHLSFLSMLCKRHPDLVDNFIRKQLK
ncbi:NUDIX hydrolase [Brassicibacter mesophilus]|uniref:NUDIX hydrolase n=1 Tax=Brassicibacter mesophilus TaxID=745119 RepID=UPI003D1C8076